ILVEHPDHVHMAESMDGIAADAHRRGLSQPGHGRLMHGLVGKSSRSRHDAYAALGMDGAGSDAYFANAGGRDTGAIRSDENAFLRLQVIMHLEHVHDGNALRDGHDEVDARIGRLQDGVRREWRGHEYHGGIGSGFLGGFGHAIEYREPIDGGTAFFRGDAPHYLGSVFPAFLGMEQASLAGDALGDEPRILADQNGHLSS